MKVGEQKLLPAVRAAEQDTLLITDGFSCRSQIEHGTGRRAHHISEVLALAYEQAGGIDEHSHSTSSQTQAAHHTDEAPQTPGSRSEDGRSAGKAAALAGGAALATGGIALGRRLTR